MSKVINEPVLIKNPENGHYINIAPLFNFVNEDYDGHFRATADSIDNVIRLMACTPFATDESDPLDIACQFQFLYRLRDVINSVSEFKEERRA